MTEVYDTTPAGAKEYGTVEPALAAPERASNKKLAVGKMDKRKIPARFEKSNVIDPHDPTFDIVSQENEIIAAKQLNWLVSLTHRIESRQPFRFFSECHYYGRMVASIDGKIVLRKRYPNTSSTQSGENLSDSYGRKRYTTRIWKQEVCRISEGQGTSLAVFATVIEAFSHTTNSIAVPRAPGVSHDSDAFQQ